ncbi:MAG TPA: NUDIX domain-containing protein, partial [Alphaproteobacteria bacterium]|nr:NUDIX domain-containing protein [Alphaproteobacteria bacterium]
AGLGYYARARNLHKCARAVCERHHGRFPDDEQELRQLPGVGDYTAAASAAIAYDRPAAVMDGNVERVVARLAAVTEPLPAAKPRLRALTAALTPTDRPGDHAQAMMDLGATVCTPRRPKCILCPWTAACAARRLGIEEALPAKLPKPEKPTRRGVAFWLVNGKGAVLLRRRPEKGLLGGMMEVPSSPWAALDMPDLAAVLKDAPARTGWRLLPGLVRHTFTHFHLELAVAVGRVGYEPPLNGRWVAIDALADEALPTVMVKVARHAFAHAAAKDRDGG